MFLTSSLGGNIFQFVVVLVIFIGILVLTGFATKWIATYMHNQNFNSNSNFHVVDALNMGPNHKLLLVKVGKKKYFILGMGKESISKVGEISEEELVEQEQRSSSQRSFDSILSKFFVNDKSDDK
jgi:flagellar protein FliO/FliZ